MKGVLLLDGDGRNLSDHELGADSLDIIRWARYEAENYLLVPSALERFVRGGEAADLFTGEKIKKMYEFSDSISEINMILNKLKKEIPATKLRKLSSKLKKRPEPKKKQSLPVNQVNKLQQELELIEKKLDSLT